MSFLTTETKLLNPDIVFQWRSLRDRLKEDVKYLEKRLAELDPDYDPESYYMIQGKLNGLRNMLDYMINAEIIYEF